jgi:hypothetical protein
MFRSKFIVPALSVACLLASQAVVPTLAMASSPLRAIVAQSPAGGHLVHVNLANNTGSPLDVKIGETPATIAAGETVNVSAPAGTKITVVAGSPTRAAGSVLAEVSKELSGATIRIN